MDYVAIRRTSFTDLPEIDYELTEICKSNHEHLFLANPACQVIYLYLVNYVQRLSEFHFHKPLSQLSLLDWGCGKGHNTYLLTKIGNNPICCDRLVANGDSCFGQATPILDKLGKIPIALKHDYYLPFDDQSLDVVLSYGVLEHVPSDLESLKEIYRVLRPNGLFFCFFLPYYFSWTQRLAHLRKDFYHNHLYSRKRVNYLLKTSGFEVLDIWHRQLIPKNSFRYSSYRLLEKADLFLSEHTPIKYIATNIEFLAIKNID